MACAPKARALGAHTIATYRHNYYNLIPAPRLFFLNYPSFRDSNYKAVTPPAFYNPGFVKVLPIFRFNSPNPGIPEKVKPFFNYRRRSGLNPGKIDTARSVSL